VTDQQTHIVCSFSNHSSDTKSTIGISKLPTLPPTEILV
jgi:hypothetical protein